MTHSQSHGFLEKLGYVGSYSINPINASRGLMGTLFNVLIVQVFVIKGRTFPIRLNQCRLCLWREYAARDGLIFLYSGFTERIQAAYPIDPA